jgi:hypothetical protein
MEDLTGFTFKRIDEPGPMMIECKVNEPDLKFFSQFGVKKEHFPRFAVTGNDPAVQSLGRWTDNGDSAFAWREYEGFKSLYVGTGPVPVEILRWLAAQSGVHLWSSKPDNIRATLDAAMIVASDRGERVLQFPQPLAPAEGGAASRMHRLVMEFGDVKVFVKR